MRRQVQKKTQKAGPRTHASEDFTGEAFGFVTSVVESIYNKAHRRMRLMTVYIGSWSKYCIINWSCREINTYGTDIQEDKIHEPFTN